MQRRSPDDGARRGRGMSEGATDDGGDGSGAADGHGRPAPAS